MDYRKFIQSSSIDVKVSDYLIEYNKSTWQIKNIAATVIDNIKIPLNEPEPIFSDKKPDFDIDLVILAIAFGFSWIIGALFLDTWFGWVLAGCAFTFIIYLGYNTYRSQMNEWMEKKNEIQRQWNIWDEMKRNPPVIHTLMLETNAGSKTLFYSLEESQIVSIRDNINKSMQNKIKEIHLNIDTVNIGGDGGVNNFGSIVYRQIIKEK